jgi:hypothetical protein
VPLTMGAEIKRTRSVYQHLLWGGLVVMAVYLLATWAIMVTVPAAATGGSVTVPLPMVVSFVFGSAAGKLLALMFAAWMFVVGAVYNYSFGRLLFVPSLDHVLPASLARLSRRRVPVTAQWTQILLAVGWSALIFVVLPVVGIGGSPADTQTKVVPVAAGAVPRRVGHPAPPSRGVRRSLARPARAVADMLHRGRVHHARRCGGDPIRLVDPTDKERLLVGLGARRPDLLGHLVLVADRAHGRLVRAGGCGLSDR